MEFRMDHAGSNNAVAFEDAVLHLSSRADRCTVLGPGVRAVLWVQGCPFRCPGCVAPHTLPFEGGTRVSVAELADELAVLPEIDGITFSGGEPMAQAGALARLIDLLKPRRDYSYLCYTGFTRTYLEKLGTADQHALLERLDILIDGPFLQDLQADLRWRGSENQIVHFLTPRHLDQAERVNDRGTWIEFDFRPDGLQWMGIPPKGFRDRVPAALLALGIELA
jgi:anaerobic ribonucleoside-triphosphate reductase activating protein